MRSCQFKGCPIVMVERCWQPGPGCVACPAVVAKLAIVMIVLSMAGEAIGRSAFVNIVSMACCTSRLGMTPCQFEGSQVVVKGCREPAAGCVAVRTGCAQQAGVRIGVSMTTGAVGWCSLEDTIDMATGAGDIDVFPGQLVCKQVVVNGSGPTCNLVAQGTIRAILPVMLIIFFVAGIAVGRRSPEDLIDMATLTGHTGMFAL